MDKVIEAYKEDLDHSLIRRSLRMTVEERLRRLEEMARLREELRRAGEKSRNKRSAAT
jgi:hypothetical protein